MKKIVISALAVMVMTVGVSANEDSFFDYKQEVGIGVSYQYFPDFTSNDTNYAINVNGKAMKKVAKSVAIGLTIGIDYNPDVNANVDGTEYFIDFLPTITYVINDKIDVSAMIGYTIGERDYDNAPAKLEYRALAYGVAASYEFSPQWRVNLQVLNTDGEYTQLGWSGDYDIIRTTVGVGYNF